MPGHTGCLAASPLCCTVQKPPLSYCPKNATQNLKDDAVGDLWTSAIRTLAPGALAQGESYNITGEIKCQALSRT